MNHKKNALTPPELCAESRGPVAADTTHRARKLQAVSLLPSSLIPSMPAASTAGSSSSSSSIDAHTHSIHASNSEIAAYSSSSWQQRIAAALSFFVHGNSKSGASSPQDRVQADLDFISRFNAEASVV
jgi:exo-beta-1,3-glucanase (GH17 family)